MNRKKIRGKLVLGLIIAWLIFVLLPVKNIVFSDIWWQPQLIVLTNEAEARPCGGFVTAVGEFQVFPPKIWLKNSYALEPFDFGPAPEPVTQVANRLKFWDLTVNPDIEKCSDRLRIAYNQTFNTEIENVILADISVVESVLRVINGVKLDDQVITDKTFFPVISRTVASVDRHDEVILETRKQVLPSLAKQMMKKISWQFWRWPQLTRALQERLKTGNLWLSNTSEYYKPLYNDFAVLEWNLGGGKTSRALRKTLQLTVQEQTPKNWRIFGQFSAVNLSGPDEPVGQTWQGRFELVVPEIFGQTSQFIPAEIPAGERFVHEFTLDYTGELYELGIFRPRGQELRADVQVQLYPQQQIMATNFPKVLENSADFFGEITERRQYWWWQTAADTTAPFLTFHRRISTENLSPELQTQFQDQNFVVEIHTNERVKLEPNFTAQLTDRNFTDKTTTEDLTTPTFTLLTDHTTLLLGFNQETPQPEERFSLSITGLSDWYGNAFQSAQNTVIDR